MNRFGLLFALLATLGSAAYAQSNVTIYGLADLGIDIQSGGPKGRVTKVSSGMTKGSGLGFYGSEDMGGGYAAHFLMEAGFAMDTGVSTQGGALFGRQIYVGIRGPFGNLTVGRQYTSTNNTLCGIVDPFVCGLAGTAANLMSIGGTPTNGGSGSRTNNAIKYASPSYKGLTGEVTVGVGEVPGDSRAARTYGGAAIYKQGPLTAFLSYNGVNNATATETAKVTILGGKYDFGVAAVRAAVSRTRNAFSGGTNVPLPDGTDYIVAVSVPVTTPLGLGTVIGSYIDKHDHTAVNNDAHQIAVGYFHFLSTRTALYTSYGRIHNSYPNTAVTPLRFFTVGNAMDGGTGNKAFSVGIRHIF